MEVEVLARLVNGDKAGFGCKLNVECFEVVVDVDCWCWCCCRGVGEGDNRLDEGVVAGDNGNG